jgi:hypothetical protein
MKHNVHIFAVVRVLVCGVEAEAMEEAVKKADTVWGPNARALLDRAFHSKEEAERRGFTIAETEYAEEVNGYHVDVTGDEGYAQSRWFDGEGKLDLAMHPQEGKMAGREFVAEMAARMTLDEIQAIEESDLGYDEMAHRAGLLDCAIVRARVVLEEMQ